MEFLLVWAALVIGFIAGAVWNTDAYDRGYRDGLRDGGRR